MGQPDLVLRSRRVVTPEGVRPAAVSVEGGKIAAVLAPTDVASGFPVADVGDHIVMPGLVDCHGHVNEPGRTDWEGFETATSAAAAGGVTTIVDMPLNSIPATTTLAGLEEKAGAAAGRCMVDYAFWGGVVPDNLREMLPMRDAGVRGFKCFLVPSGVPEFAHVTEEDLRPAMKALAHMGGTLLVHAELPEPIDRAPRGEDATRYSTFLWSRPRASENEAIAKMIRLCRETACRVHIVHLSSAEALPGIREAKGKGLPITVETCPHYLTFFAEEVPDGATQYKCCPPIRESENGASLWSGLQDGVIDLIVSDHSPSPASMKRGDFLTAWGGISSLQLSLCAVWTQAHARGIPISQVCEWMSGRTAVLARLEGSKGRIAPGCDADLVVFDPDAEWMVDPSCLYHRHSVTPYAGRTLRGRVEATFVRGRQVWDGHGFPSKPIGQRL